MPVPFILYFLNKPYWIYTHTHVLIDRCVGSFCVTLSIFMSFNLGPIMPIMMPYTTTYLKSLLLHNGTSLDYLNQNKKTQMTLQKTRFLAAFHPNTATALEVQLCASSAAQVTIFFKSHPELNMGAIGGFCHSMQIKFRKNLLSSWLYFLSHSLVLILLCAWQNVTQSHAQLDQRKLFGYNLNV